MEHLENIADSDPDRVQVLKKAKVEKLLYENNQVVGVEYVFKGQKYQEKGVVILATGGTQTYSHLRKLDLRLTCTYTGYAADFADDGMLAKYRPDTLKLSTTNGGEQLLISAPRSSQLTRDRCQTTATAPG